MHWDQIARQGKGGSHGIRPITITLVRGGLRSSNFEAWLILVTPDEIYCAGTPLFQGIKYQRKRWLDSYDLSQR